MRQIFPEILPLEAIVAMVDELLEFFAVWEDTFAAVEAYIVLGESAHGVNHLLIVFEIDQEPAFGVDEIVLDSVGDILE